MDAVAFLKELSEQATVMAEAKQLHLKTDWPQEPAIVNGDVDQLRRLFLNLIDNAIKYTEPGGSVRVSATVKDQKVLMTVSDTGRGIPPDHLEKIFEKFHRVHNHDGVSGSGLGLSIALSIAKAHRGHIDVESELSKGTTFTVVLPLV